MAEYFGKTLKRLNDLKKLSKLSEALEIVAVESDKRCPKKTKYLVNSRRVKILGNSGIIAYTAPYSVYVHEIMHYNHPNGEAKFLENAWKVKEKEFLKKLME